MTTTEAAEILTAHNAWRRGDDGFSQMDPKLIGDAIDAAIAVLDQLADAERDDA